MQTIEITILKPVIEKFLSIAFNRGYIFYNNLYSEKIREKFKRFKWGNWLGVDNLQSAIIKINTQTESHLQRKQKKKP